MENNSQQRTVYGVLGALIFLLLLTNAYLMYRNAQLKNTNQSQSENIGTLEEQKAELQKEYDGLVVELDGIKVQNAALDSTVANMQTFIDKQKSRIDGLLKKSGVSASELTEARSLIASLRTATEDYKRQIDQLTAENQHLTRSNEDLTTQKQNLTTQKQALETEVQTKNQAIAGLESEKQNLSTERTKLSDEKEQLSKQVNRAAVMQAKNIKAVAVRSKSSGKEVEVSRNQRAQKIKVCFDIIKNAIAKSGNKEIVMRIISPEGSVLAVQSLGSGTFVNSDTGETMQYTSKAVIQYNAEEENYCMYWEQNSDFAEGSYTAELYNDGYLMGASAFSLK